MCDRNHSRECHKSHGYTGSTQGGLSVCAEDRGDGGGLTCNIKLGVSWFPGCRNKSAPIFTAYM